MKKLIVTAIIVLGIAAVATAQSARNNVYGYGNDMAELCMNNGGKGKNINKECGYANGGMGYNSVNNNKQQPDYSVKNVDEAKNKVQEFINNKGINGFTLVSIETAERPRGLIYIVNATDTAGNKVVFHVNPWGNVAGPFFIK